MSRTATLFLLLLVPALFAPVRARAQAPPDTIVALPDVTVTATRTETTVAAAPVRVTVLDREEIARTGAQHVAELLEARAGLFVRRYGSSGLATLSLRGTGAEQTLILLDGHRIADPQLGQLDLSLLPTILLTSVEIMHGAASPLYGSDGVGGAVNLRTHSPEAGRSVRLIGGVGAYGERTGGFLLAGGEGRFSGLALFEFAGAEGDFPYRSTVHVPARTLHREGADYDRRAFYAAAGYRGAVHRLRVSTWYNVAERGLPGLATTPPKGERQWDEHLRVWLDDEVRLGWGTLRLGGLVQRGALRYLNPQLDLDVTGRTFISSAEAEATFLAGPRWLLAAGASGSYSAAAHPDLADRARQRHAAAFLHGTGRYGPLLVYPALRADTYFVPGRAARLALSPGAGLNVQPHPGTPLHLKAHVGRAFRAPTLNSLFWQPGGNPGLRPEHGWTFDGGLYLQQRRSRAEISFFAVRMRDQIVWLRAAAGHFAPVNVSRVHTKGLEVSFGRPWALLGRRLGTNLHYTWTDARDLSEPGAPGYGAPLRYVPREQLKLNLSAGLGALTLDLNGRYTGRRYVTTDGTQFLDPYVVLDAQLRLAGTCCGMEAEVSLLFENLLDADYAVLQHYPMPPRHARLRLLLQTKSPPSP